MNSAVVSTLLCLVNHYGDLVAELVSQVDELEQLVRLHQMEQVARFRRENAEAEEQA